MYGLAPSPGIFQRIMLQLLGGIPNVIIFSVDILKYGDSFENHWTALNNVLNILKEHGMKVKKSKCTFSLRKLNI